MPASPSSSTLFSVSPLNKTVTRAWCIPCPYVRQVDILTRAYSLKVLDPLGHTAPFISPLAGSDGGRHNRPSVADAVVAAAATVRVPPAAARRLDAAPGAQRRRRAPPQPPPPIDGGRRRRRRHHFCGRAAGGSATGRHRRGWPPPRRRTAERRYDNNGVILGPRSPAGGLVRDMSV